MAASYGGSVIMRQKRVVAVTMRAVSNWVIASVSVILAKLATADTILGRK